MDGLFQILILVFFVVASIFDAVARNRKKQEQKDRMDQEEAAEQGAPAVRPGTRRPPSTARERESGGREQVRGRPQPSEGPRKAPVGEAEPRTTADQMIPEDFWAVLTGQAPVEREEVRVEREPHREPTREPAEVAAYTPKPWAGMDRTADTEESEEPETRRSSRWMEGLGKEEDRRALESAQRADRQVPVTAVAAPVPRRPDPMDEPWGEMEDISRGEIGDGRGAVQGAVDLMGDAGSRRYGATESPYVRLVASGRQEDLKAAIVLREVLGAPVGSRPASEGPGGWRWDGP
jgi:hypothetical protein